MNIGVCGTGTIASWVSSILNQLGNENIVLYGCATSPGFDCSEFAEKFGWKKVYASFEELMSDADIDVVYVALPNNMHYDVCKQAIEHGKNVVCEKPFAVNEKLAKEIIELAREKNLFLSEALWPSFLPIRKMINDAIKDGIIGEVREGKIMMLDNVLFLDRIKSMELGGGSLLDGVKLRIHRFRDRNGIIGRQDFAFFRRRGATAKRQRHHRKRYHNRKRKETGFHHQS